MQNEPQICEYPRKQTLNANIATCHIYTRAQHGTPYFILTGYFVVEKVYRGSAIAQQDGRKRSVCTEEIVESMTRESRDIAISKERVECGARHIDIEMQQLRKMRHWNFTRCDRDVTTDGQTVAASCWGIPTVAEMRVSCLYSGLRLEWHYEFVMQKADESSFADW